VVVYKVDRLTRSLTDFAKLVDLFDRCGVSFVSITQAFNTTTSMGRLTLNVLLSFAQFEREVIGERVRDKIAASKRKGIWVGGPVPLGYVSVNKKLEIVPDEAETVRGIFLRYLELGSVRLLVADLDRNGIRTKRRDLASGEVVGGGRFGVGALSYFLKNRFYIGEVAYRGEIHAGEHAPILDRTLFDEVQARLAANNVERRLTLKCSAALLAGRIYDDRGNRMGPSHTTKKGVRYRYYVSNAILQEREHEAGSVSRVPAPEIEEIVVQALRTRFDRQGESSGQSNGELLQQIKHVVITPKAIQVHFPEANEDCDEAQEQKPIMSLPWAPQKFTCVKGISRNLSDDAPALKPETRDALLAAIAKARGWVDGLVSCRIESIEEIARQEDKVERYIRLLLSLAFTPPEMVGKIVGGSARADMTVTGLAKVIPLSWATKYQ
jgi:site-specific DNA recombinase